MICKLFVRDYSPLQSVWELGEKWFYNRIDDFILLRNRIQTVLFAQIKNKRKVLFGQFIYSCMYIVIYVCIYVVCMYVCMYIYVVCI